MNAMPPKTTVSAHAAVDDRPVKSFQTGQVVSLSICHFIHDVYSSFLAPLLPLLIKKLSTFSDRSRISYHRHAGAGLAEPLPRHSGRPHQRSLFHYIGAWNNSRQHEPDRDGTQLRGPIDPAVDRRFQRCHFSRPGTGHGGAPVRVEKGARNELFHDGWRTGALAGAARSRRCSVSAGFGGVLSGYARGHPGLDYGFFCDSRTFRFGPTPDSAHPSSAHGGKCGTSCGP